MLIVGNCPKDFLFRSNIDSRGVGIFKIYESGSADPVAGVFKQFVKKGN